jgi:hypothetical protein
MWGGLSPVLAKMVRTISGYFLTICTDAGFHLQQHTPQASPVCKQPAVEIINAARPETVSDILITTRRASVVRPHSVY